MTIADAVANRHFLRTRGRAAYAPSAPVAALTLINSAGAAAFALAVVVVLTGPARGPSLVGLGVALMIRALAVRATARLAGRHAMRIKSQLRREALAAVLARVRGESTSVGEAAGAVVEEVEAVDGYFSRYRPAELDARIGPLVIAGAVALASPIAAMILLITLIPFVAIMALAGGAAGAEADRQFEALARLSGHFVDRVRALPVVLAFQAEDAETAKVGAAAQDVANRTLGVLRVAFISTAALEFFAALAVALVAVYCGFSLLGLLPFEVPESLDFQRAFFALALAPEFYAPLRRLAAAYHEKQMGEAAAGRLRPLLLEPPVAPPMRLELKAAPEVRLRNLTLRFGDVMIGPLEAIAPAGGLTAIVGPTGSGKSSVLAAILGLTPLEAGSVEVAGLRLADTGGFSDLAAWAGQAPAFLPGAIVENLMAASPDVSRDAALSMADRVGLSPALAGRTNSADTVLDERGSGLSGGERRRLALARALLKPARLLLLDEPTADLDTVAEAEIIALIRDIAGQRTIIVATHSEALANAADHVVRLP
ncbi:MAG: ATP-binding cassette domain-containing protein [Phenylobacterium sp.]|nr:ATP-binding cassette domain-containing protein [Phenylobacterium sp.]